MDIEWLIPGWSAFVTMERDLVDYPDGFRPPEDWPSPDPTFNPPEEL